MKLTQSVKSRISFVNSFKIVQINAHQIRILIKPSARPFSCCCVEKKKTKKNNEMVGRARLQPYVFSMCNVGDLSNSLLQSCIVMHVGHTLLPRYICIARVEFLWCCNVSICPTHTCTHAYNVQRLWLPRQAARQRSCCNLYAKLFYKLSKKDGVSRKHSRWHTHTNTHTLEHTSQQVASKWGKQAACRISHGFSFNYNSKTASASASEHVVYQEFS